jgi:hypothetical protein
MTIQNHHREGIVPKKDDVLVWMGVHMIIRRVGRTKTWADALFSQGKATWTKRVRLPLPADVTPCAHPDDQRCDCARIPDTGFPEET